MEVRPYRLDLCFSSKRGREKVFVKNEKIAAFWWISFRCEKKVVILHLISEI